MFHYTLRAMKVDFAYLFTSICTLYDAGFLDTLENNEYSTRQHTTLCIEEEKRQRLT